MGFGLHGGGKGAAKFFAQQGARVLVTDPKTRKELKDSVDELKGYKINYVLGKHRVGDFKNTDLIIKNPAVSKDSKYLKIARKNKVPIETDVGLFFELCPSKKIIGITGTKGKSTTATLITKLLKVRHKVVLAGNIRASVLEELPRVTKDTIVVLELSSWQLGDLKKHKKAPHIQIAVITNIMPDHLNRHKGMKDYIGAKKLIFRFQTADDFLILNNDDKIVREFAKESESKAIFYSKLQAMPYLNYIRLAGEHNLYNISVAITVAKIFKIPDSTIKKVLKKFKGIEGRLEFVKEIKEVKYYNDTTATTPEATIAALRSFSRPVAIREKNIILIAGGTDKKLNFKELAKEILKPVRCSGRVKLLILLPGTATKKLEKAIRLQRTSPKLTKKIQLLIIKVKNMKQAVSEASKRAGKGDIVLLSPGCASFGLFQHEFDRGKRFKKNLTS